MLNKSGGFGFTLTVIFFLVAILIIAGCGGGQMEADVAEEKTVLDGRGTYIGQIDSQSVEIEVAGEPKVFALGEGIDLSDLSDGSEVEFTYIDDKERPLLQSIEAIKVEAEVIHAEGTYVGQIDTNSVEIEVDGQFRAYALNEGLDIEEIEDGSRIKFSYRDEARPILESIEVIEAPIEDENDMVLTGEGTLIGLIDSRSVEIEIHRAFMLGEGVSAEGIEEGSLVAFTFTEAGQRAVIDWIEAVDQYMEGEVMHGTLAEHIDGQSVEIHYVQPFTIGEGIDIREIEEGTEIVFTYGVNLRRPVLKSVSER
ncbi:MAG: hypothetical protein ACQES4_01170 [Bacillota bacterium]